MEILHSNYTSIVYTLQYYRENQAIASTINFELCRVRYSSGIILNATRVSATLVPRHTCNAEGAGEIIILANCHLVATFTTITTIVIRSKVFFRICEGYRRGHRWHVRWWKLRYWSGAETQCSNATGTFKPTADTVGRGCRWQRFSIL